MCTDCLNFADVGVELLKRSLLDKWVSFEVSILRESITLDGAKLEDCMLGPGRQGTVMVRKKS